MNDPDLIWRGFVKIIGPHTIWGFNAPWRLQRAPSPHRVAQLCFRLCTAWRSSARFNSHPALHFLLFPNKRDLGRERDRQGRLQRAPRSGVLTAVVVEVVEAKPSLMLQPRSPSWSLRPRLYPPCAPRWCLRCDLHRYCWGGAWIHWPYNPILTSRVRSGIPFPSLPVVWSQAPESILNWVWPWVRGF
jgi:hypothetical protein